MSMSLTPSDAGQFVLDLHHGEIAQIELVVAALGRVDGDAHQHVGRAFLHGDAGLLDDVGQRRQRQADAILHQHLRHVQIDAVLERDRQVVGAVVGAARGHVEHALDAVDLLLDRRGHRAGHVLGAGAGIVATSPRRWAARSAETAPAAG